MYEPTCTCNLRVHVHVIVRVYYCSAPPNAEVHEPKPTIRELKKRLEERRGREREVWEAPISPATATGASSVPDTWNGPEFNYPVQPAWNSPPAPAARPDAFPTARPFPVAVSHKGPPGEQHAVARLVQLVPASPRLPPRSEPDLRTEAAAAPLASPTRQLPSREAAHIETNSEQSSSDEEAATVREANSEQRLEAVRRLLGNYSLQNLGSAELLAHMRAGSEPDESSSRAPAGCSPPHELLAGSEPARAADDALAPPEPLLLALELERQRRHRVLVLKQQLAAEATKKTRDITKGT